MEVFISFAYLQLALRCVIVCCCVGVFLDTLDGGDMTSYFDFFFESQPQCPTYWAFKDEELREDFRDYCRDMNCLPSMRAAQEGEDEEDKKVRKAKEAAETAAGACVCVCVCDERDMETGWPVSSQTASVVCVWECPFAIQYTSFAVCFTLWDNGC